MRIILSGIRYLNMIIAVNTRLLIKDKLEGIGWFTYETLKRITQNHSEHEFIFIFDRPWNNEFIFGDNITPVIAYPQARHPVLWYLFFELGVPGILKKYKPDLFLSPDGWLSLKSSVKSISVIHDLNFFHFPEFIPWHVLKYYQRYFPRFVQKSSRIATVSQYTKTDIVNRFKYPEERIDVVYNGANELYRPLDIEEKQKVQETYTEGDPYFLFIGLIHPRKNLANIIRAYSEFRKSQNSNVKLLVVGSKKWWNKEHQQAVDSSSHVNDIIFIGRQNLVSLRKITGSALALVYASYFEGFGIPILEAMYCGVPVITSDTSSMPEVGGEAAIYVNPASVESIKNAMLLIFNDMNLRQHLIKNSEKQRNQFTWDKTAELLWKCVERDI